MKDPHDPGEAIRALREDFVRASARRLAVIDEQIARLRQSPGDRAALKRLESEVRAFASLAKSSGFPKVSKLAQERAVSGADVEAWSSLASAIRAELGLATSAPASGDGDA